ncbi:IQ domain-containing protein K-like [Halichondria panicea]|uniref:IQ domain-containing protein K-like n=1 Tax=Halichondria panicea TaxID=6063 RepID=UPI00312B8AD9
MDLSVGVESPASFLEKELFEILLPGLEETLKVAKSTERRKRFNALDYLVEYLYRHNPNHHDRESLSLKDIPFVKEEWEVNPRPPLPLSATLTEEQAAVIIQAHYRGHLARKQGNAKLFRSWKKEVEKEKSAIKRIQKKWRKISATKSFISRTRKQPTLSPIPPSPINEDERPWSIAHDSQTHSTVDSNLLQANSVMNVDNK